METDLCICVLLVGEIEMKVCVICEQSEHYMYAFKGDLQQLYYCYCCFHNLV